MQVQSVASQPKKSGQLHLAALRDSRWSQDSVKFFYDETRKREARAATGAKPEEPNYQQWQGQGDAEPRRRSMNQRKDSISTGAMRRRATRKPTGRPRNPNRTNTNRRRTAGEKQQQGKVRRKQIRNDPEADRGRITVNVNLSVEKPYIYQNETKQK